MLTVEEILSKDISHLRFALTDKHMYQNKKDDNIALSVLSKFKGEKLSLVNVDFHKKSLDQVFAEASNLTHFELNNVTFTKGH